MARLEKCSAAHLQNLQLGANGSYGLTSAQRLMDATPIPRRPLDTDRHEHIARLITEGRLPQKTFVSSALRLAGELQVHAQSPQTAQLDTDDAPAASSAVAAEFTYSLARILAEDMGKIVGEPITYPAKPPLKLTGRRYQRAVNTINSWFNDLIEEGMLTPQSRSRVMGLFENTSPATTEQIAFATANLYDFLAHCEMGIPLHSDLHSYSQLVRALLREINTSAVTYMERSSETRQ